MKSYNDYLRKTIKKDPTLKDAMEFESWLFELSLNIANLRKAKGYSQTEFAKLLDMSQSAVARIESGQNMKCSTLWEISKILETDLVIFNTSIAIEQQKFEDFYLEPSKIKQFTGSTENKEEITYNVEATHLKPNYTLYGNACTFA